MSANKLTSLSDHALTKHLRHLVRREREVLLDVLHHLGEVDRRKLYLKLGHGSLFAYCTEGLKYSRSAAGRRTQAAHVIRRFPSVIGLLERGEVNLSTISKVARIALSQGDAGIFERIRGMTQDEAEVVASEYRPQERPRDRVRPVSITKKPVDTAPVAMPLAGAATVAAEAGAGSVRTANDKHSRRGSARTAGESDSRVPAEQASVEPAPVQQVSVEQAYMFQFVAGSDLMRAIEQVRALLSFRLPAGAPMEDVLAILAEEFIERHSPDRRRERRRQRAQERAEKGRDGRDAGDGWDAGNAENEGGECGERDEGGERHGSSDRDACTEPNEGGERADCSEPDACREDPADNPRYIPAAVRDEAFARAGGRCTYVAPDGTRCGAIRHLQVDHIVPVARGGRGDPDNVRVLCAAHNRLEAERILGAATVKRHVRRKQCAGGDGREEE